MHECYRHQWAWRPTGDGAGNRRGRTGRSEIHDDRGPYRRDDAPPFHPWCIRRRRRIHACEHRSLRPGIRARRSDISPGRLRITRQVRKIMVFTFDHGSEVDNHTMTHSSYTQRGEVREIALAQHALHDVTGVCPIFLRAAGGTMHPSIDQECERDGHTYIWTDTDERDSNMPRIAAETINANLARKLHPGYISLRHSGGTHDNTVTSMHHAIDLVEQAGYHATRSTFAWTQATQQAPISTALTTVPGMSPRQASSSIDASGARRSDKGRSRCG